MPSLPTLITLIISFGGMLFIMVKKWSALQAIEVLPSSGQQRPFKQRIKDKMTGLGPMKNSNSEKILKRLLIKTKILFMKGERRADFYLRRVSRSQKFEDDYWEKIDKT